MTETRNSMIIKNQDSDDVLESKATSKDPRPKKEPLVMNHTLFITNHNTLNKNRRTSGIYTRRSVLSPSLHNFEDAEDLRCSKKLIRASLEHLRTLSVVSRVYEDINNNRISVHDLACSLHDNLKQLSKKTSFQEIIDSLFTIELSIRSAISVIFSIYKNVISALSLADPDHSKKFQFKKTIDHLLELSKIYSVYINNRLIPFIDDKISSIMPQSERIRAQFDYPYSLDFSLKKTYNETNISTDQTSESKNNTTELFQVPFITTGEDLTVPHPQIDLRHENNTIINKLYRHCSSKKTDIPVAVQKKFMVYILSILAYSMTVIDIHINNAETNLKNLSENIFKDFTETKGSAIEYILESNFINQATHVSTSVLSTSLDDFYNEAPETSIDTMLGGEIPPTSLSHYTDTERKGADSDNLDDSDSSSNYKSPHSMPLFLWIVSFFY